MTSNYTEAHTSNKETQNLLLRKLSGVANIIFHQIVAVEFYEGGETHQVLSRKANTLLYIFERHQDGSLFVLESLTKNGDLNALIAVTARVVKYACAIRDLQKVQNCDFQFDEETTISNLIRSTKGLMWEAQISLLDLMLDREEQVHKGRCALKNKIPTDSQIIKDVHHALVEASAYRGNWVDYLPDYIDLDQNHADESHYIGTLADGRNIYYTPEAMDICLIEEAK